MKLDTVVIGTDFSTSSVEAVRWVARQFAPSADLVMLHVINIPEAPPIVRSKFPRRDLLVDTVREGAEKRLREMTLSVGARRVWLEIREGHPVEQLTRVAEEYSADMIVVGAHGERAGRFEGLGSTAEHLVRVATRPVLLVTKPRLTPPSCILVAVDKLERTPEALVLAGVLGQQLEARVTVTHVVPAGVASSVLMAAAVISGTPSPALTTGPVDPQASDRWLDAVIAAGSPRERTSSEVAFGDPTSEILSAAERLDADLIVMGRRTAGSVRRAVLGSVVDGVLRRSKCPVLVVPALEGTT